MGFDDKKESAQKALGSMTLNEITTRLDSLASTLRFNGSGTGERTSNNFRHLSLWAGMNADAYKQQLANAKENKKTIDQFSGAITPDGAVRAPTDDSGEYIVPFLVDILRLQDERLKRIAYAKEMELKDLSTG